MALPTSNSTGTSDSDSAIWRALRPTLLDPMIMRWVQPLILVTVFLVQFLQPGALRAPTLLALGLIAVALMALQVQLYVWERSAYAAPRPVQAIVTCLVLATLGFEGGSIPWPIFAGALILEVWLDLVYAVARFLPGMILQPLRWLLPVLATGTLLAGIRVQEIVVASLFVFLLPLWLAVLPEPQHWES